ncbi:cell division protein FtsL [Bacillus sp. 2205SS5-2]|uniref:cell division protein FtsL n=1 Tax=Bacillus sp. 2205SS5-2 TaxID=3109031 RepID=UPI003006AF84
MSNLARKYQDQTVTHVQPSKQPTSKPRVAKRLFTAGEKLLFSILIAIVSFLAVQIVTTQAAIYEVNKGIQEVESSIESQQKVNENLKVQIGELSEYDRILEKAKRSGLDLKEENIKVVESR